MDTIGGYDYELKLSVRDYELDVQGIVNNANYLHYMEHTRHGFCRSVGFSFDEMHSRGIDPVLRKAEIEYLTPLCSGDEMISCLSLRREGARFVFKQDIYRASDKAPVCRANITVVCLENGKLTRGDVLAAAFDKYLK